MENFNEALHELIPNGYRIKTILASEKRVIVLQIKAEAGERIKALDWMHSRADRHSALGKPLKKAKAEVYQLQQDIEELSDQAEIDVNALTTVEAVQAFTW